MQRPRASRRSAGAALRRLARLVPAVALASAGCLTATEWEVATASEVARPVAVARLVPREGGGAPPDAPDLLIVRYRAGTGGHGLISGAGERFAAFELTDTRPAGDAPELHGAAWLDALETSPGYRRRSGGTGQVEQCEDDARGVLLWTYAADDAVPPEVRVATVPLRVPRSDGDRAWTTARAAVLTPVTLAADVVLTPVGFLFWLAFPIRGLR